MNHILHLVCLRCPWPDDTGGAREMLDRLKCMHKRGIHVRLHYFGQPLDTPVQEALAPFCARIYAYPRKLSIRRLFRGQPYIVSCRSNPELLNRLAEDQYPIVFDGLHTTAHLAQLFQSGRKIVVRMHNDEVRYYAELARSARNPLKRFYFRWESIQLHRWMKLLPAGISVGCIQQQEQLRLQAKFPSLRVFLLPPVIPVTIHTQTGTGGYCLYHGDLSVPGNERAVIWLLKRVFAKIKLPLVIAGKSPSAKLEKLIHFYQHACLVSNPSRSELIDLISKAQINVLPSRTRTGIKLKIFDALQYGRHCVVNREMAESSPWTDSCRVVEDAEKMAADIKSLYAIPFTEKMIDTRRERLTFWSAQLDPLEALIKRLW